MSKFANLVKYALRHFTPFPRHFVNGYLEWTLLRDILQAYAIDCVLDVGANRGQFVDNLRRIGYTGYICSFEPVEADFTFMRTRFGNDANWAGYNYAVGRENSQKQLNVVVGATWMSSFLAAENTGWTLSQVTVDIQRLDKVFPDVIAATGLSKPRIFLKMDTQGYDLEVIKGAEGCINDILGLQSEISIEPVYVGAPHYLDAIRIYESLGFQLYGLSEVFRKPQRNNLVEMNCVMMRPGGISLADNP